MTRAAAGVALDERGMGRARDRASMPPAPLPANRSRKRAPGRSGSRIAKSVCLTRSPSGRVPGPGASSRMLRGASRR